MDNEVVRLPAMFADGKVAIDEFFRLIGDVIESETAVSVSMGRLIL
jgi:hypothetical protein